MSSVRIAIVGNIGSLAWRTAEILGRRGADISLIESPRLPEDQGQFSHILCFPFAASPSRRAIAQQEKDLGYLRSLLTWACRAHVKRVVLRSHAIAYGASMKNPGLLEEGRPTHLPDHSLERRWLAAEQLLFSGVPAEPGGCSTASIRLASVLDATEGDLISAMLASRVAVPLAGYDPQLQLLTVEDACEYLASSLYSDAEGIFNASPAGTVPVKASLKAAVALRIPVNGVIQKPLRSLLWKIGWTKFPGESVDRIKYNWTVSNERAREAFGYSPRHTSSEGLRSYIRDLGHHGGHKVKDDYDEFGLDRDYLKRWAFWFRFLTKIYWRVELEGMQNIPDEAPALLVANHRGFMPFDGVVHRTMILAAKKRHIRFLVIPSLFKFPFLSDFLVKQGGVVASQANTRKLFARRDLVGIFPEGINGAFRMYRGAYKLGDMSRNAFAKMAIENSVPIIPSATVGHVEIFPILAKVRSSFVVRNVGWPFLPITPTFPLLPLPLPTKWHIRYLDPIPVTGYDPSDATNPKAVSELAAKTCKVMQANIDDMLQRRKHIFYGNIFGGSAGLGSFESMDAAR